MNDLAHSKTYTISHEYEVVFLKRQNQRDVVVGDFYGDPTCAVVSPDEMWCAIGGAGLIVYFLREPFEPYRYDHPASQWIEFGRDKADQWWIESVSAESESELTFTTDPNGVHPGTYTLDIVTGHLKKR